MNDLEMMDATQIAYIEIMNDSASYHELLKQYRKLAINSVVATIKRMRRNVQYPEGMGWGDVDLALLTRDILNCLLEAEKGEPVEYPNTAVMTAETPKEKDPMTIATKLENRTYLNGKDAATISDDDLFNHIASIEMEADNLARIKTTSRKVIARINELREDAEKLATYIDNR